MSDIDVEKIRKEIAALKLRRATDPSFGRRAKKKLSGKKKEKGEKISKEEMMLFEEYLKETGKWPLLS